MENDNLQKELFEFEAPKKHFRPGFGRFFQKAEFGIMLTAEKLVFISIGVIMLMVVFFALGVEKGKSIDARNAAGTVPVSTAVNAAPVKVAAAPAPQIRVAAVTNITPKERLAALKAQPQAVSSDPYTIVAAAFSRQDFASKEASILKAKGFDAFVIKSDPYYLACVGSFVSKNDALKFIARIKQLHRDAYVRLK